MFTDYKSPLGYVADGKKIDTYGVDHSGFSTKDEIEYQMARQKRENSLIEGYNNQGITKDYPQYGTNFWGKADNNYGFGNSNIADNIKNKQNQDISSALYPNQIGNDAASYKLAQNNQANTVSDANGQTLTKYQKLIDKHYNDIYKNEGNPDYVYLDPKYIRTIGRGTNINNPNAFNQVNYKIKNTNDFASEKEKQDCYDKFEDWIKNNKRHSKDKHNFKANYFEDFCNLYIDPNEAKRLHNEHVVKDIPVIKNIIKNYDELSYEKQLAILDMVYNLGATEFKNQFTKFIEAANANSEEGMLKEYHRKGISEDRNKWTADLLKK